jgi:hypothetical protein
VSREESTVLCFMGWWLCFIGFWLFFMGWWLLLSGLPCACPPHWAVGAASIDVYIQLREAWVDF